MPPSSDTVDVPLDGLVLLIGAAGSGKTTLADRLFDPAHILSSDAHRAAISGDPADQSVTDQAFARLHAELASRMADGRLSVVDATNVQGWARRRLLAAARRHARPAIAIVLALPVEVSLARNAARSGQRVPASAVRRQDRFLRDALPRLATEGYAAVRVVETPEQLDRLVVRRIPGARSRTQRNVPKERHPTH